MSDESRVGVRDARNQLGRLVDEAYYQGTATVLTKNDEPRAVLVPYDWYVRLAPDSAEG
ncbi:type II toxin-antitoxin system Phd/YefM family antitoxin [Streptomyces decoyicus]|uniref:type II toxin-antitoxin system Phd/YefM family antitoxin n=1 Tax=Streptomyces decoyicus TaxID=249567 RepID=UPI0038659334